MPIPASMFKADLAAAIGDMGQTVTFNGQTKRAFIGEVSRAKDALQAGGYFGEYSVEIHIIESDWTTAPDVSSILTAVNGQSYRVIRKGDFAPSGCRRLFCEAIQR